MIAKYPQPVDSLVDESSENIIKQMQEAVGVARSMRDSYGLKPSQKPTLYIRCRGDDVLSAMKDQVMTLNPKPETRNPKLRNPRLKLEM